MKDILAVCFDKSRSRYKRLADIVALAGGDVEAWKKNEEGEAVDDVESRKKEIRRAILEGYANGVGSPYPCDNWPKFAKVIAKAATALTSGQIKQIEEGFLSVCEKKKRAEKLTYAEDYVYTHYNADGWAYKSPELVQMTAGMKRMPKASFIGGRL